MASFDAPRGFSIGQVSRQTDVNIETIRYYERIGILPEPARTDGGHRLYEPDHINRLRFVRRSRALGFSLEEVRELLGLVDGTEPTCDQINDIATTHLADIGEKIADLRRMEKILKTMTAQCALGEVPGCPIIDALNTQI